MRTSVLSSLVNQEPGKLVSGNYVLISAHCGNSQLIEYNTLSLSI